MIGAARAAASAGGQDVPPGRFEWCVAGMRDVGCRRGGCIAVPPRWSEWGAAEAAVVSAAEAANGACRRSGGGRGAG